jgi:hypothetical protein
MGVVRAQTAQLGSEQVVEVGMQVAKVEMTWLAVQEVQEEREMGQVTQLGSVQRVEREGTQVLVVGEREKVDLHIWQRVTEVGQKAQLGSVQGARRGVQVLRLVRAKLTPQRVQREGEEVQEAQLGSVQVVERQTRLL